MPQFHPLRRQIWCPSQSHFSLFLTWLHTEPFELLAGSNTQQKFIPYGAMFGAPLGDDNLVIGRKDYSYAEPTTGAHPLKHVESWTRLTCYGRECRTLRRSPLLADHVSVSL